MIKISWLRHFNSAMLRLMIDSQNSYPTRFGNHQLHKDILLIKKLNLLYQVKPCKNNACQKFLRKSVIKLDSSLKVLGLLMDKECFPHLTCQFRHEFLLYPRMMISMAFATWRSLKVLQLLNLYVQMLVVLLTLTKYKHLQFVLNLNQQHGSTWLKLTGQEQTTQEMQQAIVTVAPTILKLKRKSQNQSKRSKIEYTNKISNFQEVWHIPFAKILEKVMHLLMGSDKLKRKQMKKRSIPMNTKSLKTMLSSTFVRKLLLCGSSLLLMQLIT